MTMLNGMDVTEDQEWDWTAASKQKQQTMTISKSIILPITIYVFNICKSQYLFVVSNRESMATLLVNQFLHLMKVITSVSTKREYLILILDDFSLQVLYSYF